MSSYETGSSERRSATAEMECPPADIQSEASRMLQISNWKKILVITEPELVVIKPGQIPVSRTIFELWEHRELIKNLVWRDLTTRYRQTILGAGWAVIQPLGFSTSLALELQQFNVRVKLVEPGYCPDTRFAENGGARMEGLFPETYAAFAQSVFAGFGEPSAVTSPADVAQAVWRAANDDSDQLRFPAGPDAVALAKAC